MACPKVPAVCRPVASVSQTLLAISVTASAASSEAPIALAAIVSAFLGYKTAVAMRPASPINALVAGRIVVAVALLALFQPAANRATVSHAVGLDIGVMAVQPDDDAFDHLQRGSTSIRLTMSRDTTD